MQKLSWLNKIKRIFRLKRVLTFSYFLISRQLGQQWHVFDHQELYWSFNEFKYDAFKNVKGTWKAIFKSLLEAQLKV